MQTEKVKAANENQELLTKINEPITSEANKNQELLISK